MRGSSSWPFSSTLRSSPFLVHLSGHNFPAESFIHSDTYVSLVWDHGCEEPWLLISDQGAGRRQVQFYAWRMGVEATFQDSKSRGWNILRQLDGGPGAPGSVAALVVSGHVVGLAPGSSLYPSWAAPTRMTRVDRRDKSIFRLGRLWLLDLRLFRLPIPFTEPLLVSQHCAFKPPE